MTSVALSSAERTALDTLVTQLQRVFGTRLQSVVAYGPAALDVSAEGPVNALVLVEHIVFDDLAACASLSDGWRRAGLATPLLLSREEFRRTLDVFPVEYGAIIDSHVPIFGTDPFAGCAVCETDLRRAVELQAKSHLIHLREGFLESGVRPDLLTRLIAASLPAYRSLLDNLDRLAVAPGDHATSHALLKELAAASTISEPSAMLQRYIAEVERIWTHVDSWR